jgi:glutamate receptor, ionotropic, plant
MWFFAAQLVLNSFTATLSSMLITQTLVPDVNTMRIGCNGNSFVQNYLISVLNYPPERIVKIYAASEYNTAFENGTITAAFLEVPYLRVFLSQHENYTVSGETKMLGGLGFVSLFLHVKTLLLIFLLV